MLQFLIRMSILLFSIFLSSCGSAHDSNLERMLATRLIDFKQSNETSLDLTPIFGNQWEKICIQGLYEPREHFEKRVDRKVPDEPEIVRNTHIWWIFYNNGTARWIRIDHRSGMDSSNGRVCTSSKNPKIYAKVVQGEKYYYFFDDKQEKQK